MYFFFSSRRRHTRCSRDWSSDVCSSDLKDELLAGKVLSADFYTALQVRRQLRPTTNRRSIKLLSLSDRPSGEILPDPTLPAYFPAIHPTSYTFKSVPGGFCSGGCCLCILG